MQGGVVHQSTLPVIQFNQSDAATLSNEKIQVAEPQKLTWAFGPARSLGQGSGLGWPGARNQKFNLQPCGRRLCVGAVGGGGNDDAEYHGDLMTMVMGIMVSRDEHHKR